MSRHLAVSIMACTATAAVWVLTAFISSAVALHGAWQDHHTAADGSRCCGLRDCQPTRLRILRIEETTVRLEMEGAWVFDLPRASFHLSEDAQDWWCARNPTFPPSTENTRCVFVAVGT